MKNNKQPTWAIRDIKHGKTFFFHNYQEMVAFILTDNKKQKEDLLKQIKENICN